MANVEISSPIDKYEDGKFFFDLLLKYSIQTNQVFARTCVDGSRVEFSGRDFTTHLSRAISYWLHLFPLEKIEKGQSVLFLTKNTYHSFVLSIAALLCGLDVMFTPLQMNTKDIFWCVNYFKGIAIATDLDEISKQLDGCHIPIINVSSLTYSTQDKFQEPLLLTLYREKKLGIIPTKLNSSSIPVDSIWRRVKLGRFAFVSFGHDGFQKPEILNIDALVLTAQNFLIHAEVPKNIYWKSLEIMSPSNPFSHLSKFCVLLRNGILGFPNSTSDWETNLRVLKPTFLFASSAELNQICAFIESLFKKKASSKRLNLSLKLDRLNQFFESSKAKISENTFNFFKRAIRTTSRTITGSSFTKEAVENLRFVVLGLAPASEAHVRLLEKFGIPVIETYGTTHAAGMLSSNQYHTPNLNTIGAPLPHVNFRLGQQSILEYRLSLPVFADYGKWEETGDVAQMTPHGFMITGRKRHLFVTLGGVVVSPARLEQLLKVDEMIADACVIGDKLPYLSVLIVLQTNVLENYKISSQNIKQHVQDVIASVNETLARNVTIKKFAILDKPFSEGNGEKLSNGEINRLKIQETCADIIASLYKI